MPTDPNEKATDQPPDSSQLARELNNSLEAADSIAAERVQNLQWVHQARLAHLSRTAASLKAQYGANDASVKTAEEAVATATAASSQIGIVHQQITTAEPDIAPGGWALHGRVFDTGLKPVSGFTVFLVDRAKAYQQAYGFAYTDDTGYFLLNYQGAGHPASSEKSATPHEAHSAELFVEVVDRRARPVYLSAAAFQPVTGIATYQNIILSEGNQPIGEPPAEIRRIAVPKSKRKS